MPTGVDQMDKGQGGQPAVAAAGTRTARPSVSRAGWGHLGWSHHPWTPFDRDRLITCSGDLHRRQGML